MNVSSAGVFPDGFDPGSNYRSVNHPRGIKATIYGASDAIYSSGFSVDYLLEYCAPGELSVYASSSLGQGDRFGYSGYVQGILLEGRASSKQLPFSMPQMPADFINSYILGNLGKSVGVIGACASFAYNLHMAVEGHQAGEMRR